MTAVTATTSAYYDQLVATARSAGVAGEQLVRFVSAGYLAQPRQLDFHAAARQCDGEDGPVLVGYGGSRGQAKSHAILSQVVLDDGVRVPDLKCLFLRSVQKAAKESFEDLVRKALSGARVEYVRSQNLLSLPNGSRVLLGGFKDERDIDKYLGIEYDLIVIEEATLITEDKFNKLRGSLRTSKPIWRPRLYASTNPGGIGTKWFKKVFVDAWRKKKEIDARYIHTTIGDNIFINPEYETYLRNLTGVLKRMWADADWDVQAGAFFDTFDYDRHTIERSEIEIGDEWEVWASMDYGFNHWNCIYLHAEDGDGVRYTVDELCHRKHYPSEIAPAIGKMLERNGIEEDRISKFFVGSDAFAKTGHAKQSIADEYRDLGFRLRLAPVGPGSRATNAAAIARRLGNAERGIAPTWYITRNCIRLIETLPYLEVDPNNPEAPLKVDCDGDTGEGGDDAYDAAVYGVAVKQLWSDMG